MRLLSFAMLWTVVAVTIAAAVITLGLLSDGGVGNGHGVSASFFLVPLVCLVATIGCAISVPIILWTLVWQPRFRTTRNIGVAVLGVGFLASAAIYTALILVPQS